MNRFEQCLAITLRHEGGWADHPRDPGGATMKGITIGTFAQWKGRQVTKDELRNISDDDVRAIYRRKYWDKVSADSLPPGLDLVAFDGAVNSGPARGARWVQSALGVEQDGKIGPATIAAAHVEDVTRAINAACDARLAFVRRLSTWDAFGRGWQRRIDDVRAQALRMTYARPDSHPLASNPVVDSQRPVSDTQSLMARVLRALARIFGGKA
jgi:lysozyme family protein